MCMQYKTSKSKVALGLTGTKWKEPILEKLNDALLKWLEELPPHRERVPLLS